MAEETENLEPNEAGSPTAKKTSGSLLNKRYLIDFDKPEPAYDSMGADAFRAFDMEDGKKAVIALARKPGVPPRADILDAHKKRIFRFHLYCRSSGVVRMPGRKEVRYVSVVDFPGGSSVRWREAPGEARPSDAQFRRVIVPNLLTALEDIFRLGLTHCGIRPENIFYDNEARTEIILGECFSEPPGLSQPVLFEPIERALAVPEGRGNGTHSADMYALGVTLLSLMYGVDLMEGKSDDEIIEQKMTLGSMLALTDGAPPSTGLVTLLRGLLIDDPEERWTLGDTQEWLSGKAPRARTDTATSRRSARSVEFAGEYISDRRTLAYAMLRHSEEAIAKIKGADFGEWLTSGLVDPPNITSIAAALVGRPLAGVDRKANDEIMLSRILRILDPGGPLRLAGIGIYLDGMASFLALSLAAKDPERMRFVELCLRSDLLLETAEAQESMGMDTRKWRNEFSRLKRIREEKAMGFGIERVLYELNPSLSCQSDIVARYQPTNVEELMRSLERVVAGGNPPAPLLDRHILAFIGAHGNNIEEEIAAFARVRTDPDARAIAMLNLLENLQRAQAKVTFKNLTAWIVDELRSLVDPLHNKDRRRKYGQKLDQLAKTGDLAAIRNGMNFERMKRDDDDEYNAVVAEYVANETELDNIKKGVNMGDLTARRTGHMLAMVIGYVILFGTSGIILLIGG